jgi:hypothetical protein
MAKRTVHMLIDDLDGGTADETISFALDGTGYEIDLSKKNAGKLRDTLSKFVAAGTRIGRVSQAAARGAARGRTTARADRDENRAIREWAQMVGIEVSDRGRLKQETIDRYHAEAGR